MFFAQQWTSFRIFMIEIPVWRWCCRCGVRKKDKERKDNSETSRCLLWTSFLVWWAWYIHLMKFQRVIVAGECEIMKNIASKSFAREPAEHYLSALVTMAREKEINRIVVYDWTRLLIFVGDFMWLKCEEHTLSETSIMYVITVYSSIIIPSIKAVKH